jgi:hypothetical protein
MIELPIEIIDKIIFMAHPIMNKNLQNQIKNYKRKRKSKLIFNHPLEMLLFCINN